MRRLFRQFSFPGGVPSHVAPETPGSIHEGGELGYSLAHAYGAAFDNPDLVVACVVGDGEAETGPAGGELALQQVPRPRQGRRGPADPAPERLQDREPVAAGAHPRGGAGPAPRRLRVPAVPVGGDEPASMHRKMAAALDQAFDEIAEIQRGAREEGVTGRPRWPMIVLRSPKGWTGPRERGRHAGREHVALPPGPPRPRARRTPRTSRSWRNGCARTARRSCSTTTGRPVKELLAAAPEGDRRMSASPHANGGLLLKPLVLPDFRDYAVPVDKPGTTSSEPTRMFGAFLRDVDEGQPVELPASWARTRPRPTGSAPCSRSPTACSRASCSRPTSTRRRPARSWRC